MVYLSPDIQENVTHKIAKHILCAVSCNYIQSIHVSCTEYIYIYAAAAVFPKKIRCNVSCEIDVLTAAMLKTQTAAVPGSCGMICGIVMASSAELSSPGGCLSSPQQRVKRAGSKTNQPVLYREPIAVCSEIHTKHIDSLGRAERRRFRR
jgi:hypothetical protein